MSKISKLNELFNKIYNKKIDIYDFFDFLDNSGLKEEIYNEVSKSPFFTFDGRMDDILERVIYIKGSKKLIQLEDFDDLINEVDLELKKIYVPTVLIFPINVVRKSKEFDKVSFKNSNIKIFPIYDDKGYFTKRKNKINDYIEQNVYMKLLPEHIKITKDSMFFNYPLMTILFNGIDSNIVKESPKIIEAVSSIIRMVNYKKSKKYSHIKFNEIVPLGTTFAVYYNLPWTSPKPPYSSGYGYSHRTSFYNILDVSIDDIEANSIVISDLVTRLIEMLFRLKRNEKETDKANNEKWINSLFIFNEAYELASRENYDAANIMLLTILESLFLSPNTRGSKSDKLINIITPKVKDKFNEEAVKNLIVTTYRMRNVFVHEGKRTKMVGRYVLDLSALTGGLEPLTNFDSDFGGEQHNLEYLNSLFKLVIYCISNYNAWLKNNSSIIGV